MWSSFDRQMMMRALQLAAKGIYTTRPNPNVGCVIAKAGKIVGEGYHLKAGEPHAEVHALKQAKQQAKGATAYVTLEPCSHFGRTPPCAQALIDAGIARVVIAATDPNPLVGGEGIQMLRVAGIQVDTDLYSTLSRNINLGFMKRMETKLPRVTVKVATSLDGKTALSNGESKWITGSSARQDVQRQRLLHCAVVTGINTVLADDCSLNVRMSQLGQLQYELKEELLLQPLRVVLDSQCRMPISAKLLQIESPVLLVSTTAYPEAFLAQLPEHVETLVLPAKGKQIDLNILLQHLGQSCNSIMVEAGATLAGRFIAQNLADELLLYQAKKILGSNGRNMLQLPDFQQMSQIPTLELIDERKVGEDTRFRFRLTSTE
ncbi:MAG: bifunctional diaminohydroxyphosphoribosylaminopyrimidine deaminase/5-amino-6-(5-phosphoribosylamino)uracil reductase RibD [Parashewanella sp.]